MPLDAETYEYQRHLAKAALTGKNHTIPNVKPERMVVYHELVSAVIRDSLQNAFPLCHKLLEDHFYNDQNSWDFLLAEFMNSSYLSSPELWKMPGGFQRFVEFRKFGEALDLPFLNDLLRFEFAEIEVYMMPDGERVPFKNEGNLEKDLLLLNSDLQILHFQFPVFATLATESLINQKGEHCLVIYRNPDSNSVHFISVSKDYETIISFLKTSPCKLSDLLAELIRIFNCNNPVQAIDQALRENLENNLKDFVITLLKEKLILGFVTV